MGKKLSPKVKSSQHRVTPLPRHSKSLIHCLEESDAPGQSMASNTIVCVDWTEAGPFKGDDHDRVPSLKGTTSAWSRACVAERFADSAGHGVKYRHPELEAVDGSTVIAHAAHANV